MEDTLQEQERIQGNISDVSSFSLENTSENQPLSPEGFLKIIKESKSPVDIFNSRLRNYWSIMKPVSAEAKRGDIKDRELLLGRLTIKNALDVIAPVETFLPVNKKEALKQTLSSFDEFLPFDVQTIDGKKFTINSFNSAEDCLNFREILEQSTQAIVDIKESLRKDIEKELLKKLWESDLDDYSKIILQWIVQTGYQAHPDEVFKTADALKKFDEFLKQNQGDFIYIQRVNRNEWESNSILISDGKGISIDKNIDVENPIRILSISGKSATAEGSIVNPSIKNSNYIELDATYLDYFINEIHRDSTVEKGAYYPLQMGKKEIASHLQFRDDPDSSALMNLGFLLENFGIDLLEFSTVERVEKVKAKIKRRHELSATK